MANYQITCIVKPDPYSPHDHITHVGGGLYPNRWVITRQEAIRQIEQGINSFYTVDPVTKVVAYVGVVREAGKVPYLRTYADGKWNNNLLELAQCPIR